jgi:hypothetical protein
MYEDDIQDSAIVEQINRRDAAQIKESVRHIHQHAQPAIAELFNKYLEDCDVSYSEQQAIQYFVEYVQQQRASGPQARAE